MKFELKNYLWIAYPIIVVIFMIFGAKTILSIRGNLSLLIAQKTQSETVEERVNILRTKVDTLTDLDLEQAGSDLELLTAAVPPSRQAWHMILGIRQAALDSGAILDSYRVGVGDVREASGSAVFKGSDLIKISTSFEVTDLAQLTALVTRLNQMMPLLRVSTLTYDAAKTDIEIEGAWNGWGQTVSDVTTPLPQYAPVLQQVKEKLSGFVDASRVEFETETDLNEAGARLF